MESLPFPTVPCPLSDHETATSLPALHKLGIKKPGAINHRLLVCLMGIGGIVPFSDQAVAYDVLQHPDGGELHWINKKIPFYINPYNSSQFDRETLVSITLESINTWRSIDHAVPRFEFKGFTTLSTADDDGINVIFFVQDPSVWKKIFGQKNKQAFAIARSWLGQNQETAGFDLLLNESRYKFTNTGDADSSDLQNTLTHEFGHVLGLNHSQVITSTMYETSEIGETSKRTLSEDDISGIHYLYSRPSAPKPKKLASILLSLFAIAIVKSLKLSLVLNYVLKILENDPKPGLSHPIPHRSTPAKGFPTP